MAKFFASRTQDASRSPTDRSVCIPGCQKNVDDIIEAVNNNNGEDPNSLTIQELQYCALNILRILKQSSSYETAESYLDQFGELPWVIRTERG